MDVILLQSSSRLDRSVEFIGSLWIHSVLITSRVPSLRDFVMQVMIGRIMLFKILSENHKTMRRGFSRWQYKQLLWQMSWDLWDFYSIIMDTCVAFKVTVGCDWEYLCNEMCYRLGSVWFVKRVLFANVSMHLALTRPSEVKWEFQNTWSCKWFIYMKEPRNVHAEVRERASLKKSSYRWLGFRTWNLEFIWLNTLEGIVDFCDSSRLSELLNRKKEAMSRLKYGRASCLALNRSSLERLFSYSADPSWVQWLGKSKKRENAGCEMPFLPNLFSLQGRLILA